MTSSEIQVIVKRFLQEYFLSRTPGMMLQNDDSLFEKGVIDSTGVLELVAFIERKFDFRVEDNELVPQNLDSVDRLVSYIQLKLQSLMGENKIVA
jgi:acyl carrier protein